MAPFGETVLAWRLVRGLTQAELSAHAGVPRPNLSAIERGDREVTLKTVRALAVALDVRPGVLVDGQLPGGESVPLTRERLERVSRAVVSGRALSDSRENALANQLAAVTTSRRRIATRGRRTRAAERAYLLLKGMEDDATLASLVDRIAGHLDSVGRDKKAD
jgi:transcriptional regulator with XRE-family HTH domain